MRSTRFATTQEIYCFNTEFWLKAPLKYRDLYTKIIGRRELAAEWRSF
jgi:hypothetical protein